MKRKANPKRQSFKKRFRQLSPEKRRLFLDRLRDIIAQPDEYFEQCRCDTVARELLKDVKVEL
jgi:hypothetical protein